MLGQVVAGAGMKGLKTGVKGESPPALRLEHLLGRGPASSALYAHGNATRWTMPSKNITNEQTSKPSYSDIKPSRSLPPLSDNAGGRTRTTGTQMG